LMRSTVSMAGPPERFDAVRLRILIRGHDSG
jgi:hypothetical protein